MHDQNSPALATTARVDASGERCAPDGPTESVASIMASLAAHAARRPLDDKVYPRVHTCVGCMRTEVRLSGGVCEACRPAYLRGRHEALLRAARASVPREFRALRLDSPELVARAPFVAREIDWARTHLAAARITLMGLPGAGKTSLVSAMLNELIDRALDGGVFSQIERAASYRFADACEMQKAAAEHPLGAGEHALVTAARRARVLVIDDFGEEPNSQTNPIPELVRFRHMHGLPTWITTGRDQETVERRYGGGLERRVFTDAAVTWLGDTP